MKIWNQAPLVRLIIPFLCGIISAIYIPVESTAVLYILCACLLVVAAIVLVPAFYVSYKRSVWFGAITTFALFLFAYQLTIYKTEKFQSAHFSKYLQNKTMVIARLADPSVEKEKSLKTVLKIVRVRTAAGKWVNTSGKAMVYLKKDSNSLALNYGDELVLYTDFKDVKAPGNPYEFNYKRFLAFHNITKQAYVKSDEWKSLHLNSGSFLLQRSFELRNSLLSILKQNQLSGDEYAVGAALMLGYTDKLDADIISAYSSTGALHVLSVSGLHVAIVYIVFGWFLFFLDKFRKGQILKAILLILFLWFYAALTGLSPSVLRAATMFSFIIAAKAFKRHTNIYNTLAASGFFLLMINPYLIMEVGFQLSYLAVIGIVYLQPKIYAWLEFDSWLLDQAWTITAVSIAAQIATFPLGLHYFHQFPNYFLLSNLVVIPVSTLILYVGIALFSFSHVPVLAKYISLAFTWLIWLLNLSVKWMESIPEALLEGISVSVSETWMIYISIILFLFFFTERKYKYLFFALCFIILLLSIQIQEQQKQRGQKELVIYGIPKTSAIDLISGKQTLLYTDTLFAKDDKGLQFHVKHNWWELGVDNTEIASGDRKTTTSCIIGNYIQFHDKRIALVNRAIHQTILNKPMKVDYLVVMKNANVKMEELIKIYDAKLIVFDASCSEYRIEKWKKQCVDLKQAFYSIPESGALIASF